MTLDEIAIKNGCDKSSLKHDYCRIYEQYFSAYHPLKLLEIGYGGYDDPDAGGESARMWLDWLGYDSKVGPTLLGGDAITITDIHPKNNVPEGVLFLQTDVTKNWPEPGEYGKTKYDIIIDDGSHLNADIIAAFKNLWPVLNPGGLYCVEDVHSSYDPYYADSHHWPGALGTAMQYFTNLAHSVNKDFIRVGVFKNADMVHDIEFLHFYRDLIIIKKAA